MNVLFPAHVAEFIGRLEPYGFKQYALPGREWINQMLHWRRDQTTFRTLVDIAAMATKGDVIVLGTSSPMKFDFLSSAQGFIGAGWFFQRSISTGFLARMD